MLKEISGRGIKIPNRKVSAGVVAGNYVFTGGQSGKDHVTGDFPRGIKAQTKQALRNIELILEAAGSKIDNLVLVNVHLTSMDDYQEYNEAWNKFFEKVSKPYPSRVTVQVAGLALEEMVIEMQGIGYIEPK